MRYRGSSCYCSVIQDFCAEDIGHALSRRAFATHEGLRRSFNRTGCCSRNKVAGMASQSHSLVGHSAWPQPACVAAKATPPGIVRAEPIAALATSAPIATCVCWTERHCNFSPPRFLWPAPSYLLQPSAAVSKTTPAAAMGSMRRGIWCCTAYWVGGATCGVWQQILSVETQKQLLKVAAPVVTKGELCGVGNGRFASIYGAMAAAGGVN